MLCVVLIMPHCVCSVAVALSYVEYVRIASIVGYGVLLFGTVISICKDAKYDSFFVISINLKREKSKSVLWDSNPSNLERHTSLLVQIIFDCLRRPKAGEAVTITNTRQS